MESRDIVVRPVAPADLASLITLNNDHPIELSIVDADRLRALLSAAALATAIGRISEPDAFLIAFDDAAPPQGPNHAWFLERRTHFLYVDRVCVAPRVRKRGLARALYVDALAAAARRGATTLCCEVNSDPPNLASDAFHAALGFHEVGSAFLADRGKTVRYLERAV
ncbi:MAG TPA: GNAT family N-acetyltransferase [Polyangiaceae bacterium]|nr:GNAT family N-acetyltransferase [Polyangiaceae bacterium]